MELWKITHLHNGKPCHTPDGCRLPIDPPLPPAPGTAERAAWLANRLPHKHGDEMCRQKNCAIPGRQVFEDPPWSVRPTMDLGDVLRGGHPVAELIQRAKAAEPVLGPSAVEVLNDLIRLAGRLQDMACEVSELIRGVGEREASKCDCDRGGGPAVGDGGFPATGHNGHRSIGPGVGG